MKTLLDMHYLTVVSNFDNDNSSEFGELPGCCCCAPKIYAGFATNDRLVPVDAFTLQYCILNFVNRNFTPTLLLWNEQTHNYPVGLRLLLPDLIGAVVKCELFAPSSFVLNSTMLQSEYFYSFVMKLRMSFRSPASRRLRISDLTSPVPCLRWSRPAKRRRSINVSVYNNNIHNERRHGHQQRRSGRALKHQ